MTPRPVVEVVSMGGTIAMTAAPEGGITPRLDAEQLLATAPGLDAIAEVRATAGPARPGAHLTLADVAGMARMVHEAIDRGAGGVVVTQGTDTLEETAYALDLMLRVAEPVVVTGAMRGPEAPGADGPANLEAAVRVAASPDARDRGVLVVLNEQAHAARWVTKAHTSRPDAFTSPEAGPVATVTEGRVRWFGAGRQDLHTGIPADLEPDRVALLTTHLGDDGTSLRAVLAQRPTGLVLEALGAGHVPLPLVAPLKEATVSIPVVLCSRIARGEVYRGTYGFPGSELDLLGGGLLWGGPLPGHKARILLALALAAGWSVEDIAGGLRR